MATATWDVHTASDELLFELCQQAETENRWIGGQNGGDRVLRLPNNIAVKYGHGVTASEAETQRFATSRADPSNFRVPEVYRYLTKTDPTWHSPRGYIFMENVLGQPLQDIDLTLNTDIVSRVAKIIVHLGTIHGNQVPGPISGGVPEGYLWGDDGARTSFASVEDMEAWLNKRLALRDKSIVLSPYPLVLCHMDLCRRNMILDENGMICLLDWGCAGLYPRFFEIASLSCLNPYDAPYEKPLLKATAALLELTEEEKKSMSLLQIARAASLRYTFENDDNAFGLPEGFHSLPLPPPL